MEARLRPILLAALLVAAGASLSVPGALSQEPCRAASSFSHVDGLGQACWNGLGYVIPVDGGPDLFTHGPDPVPAEHGGFPVLGGQPAKGGQAETVQPRSVTCADPEQAPGYGHVIYAHPPGLPDRYGELRTEIQAMVHKASGLLLAESQPFGTAITPRMLCGADGQPIVEHELLDVPGADFGAIVEALQAKGYDDPRANYWVWFDMSHPTYCGFGNAHLDDSASTENRNNHGPDYGVTFQCGWSTMLHEAAHNMGAVQPSAPHSDGYLHCNDGADVMCYAAGGSDEAYRATDCYAVPTDYHGDPFDCGKDDYFHPDPAPGTYLADHWNLAAKHNLHIQRVATEQLPGAPMGLTARPASALQPGQVQLTWQAPEDTGDGPLQGYAIYRAEGAEQTTPIARVVPGGANLPNDHLVPAETGLLSVTVPVDPAAGSIYSFQVAAISGLGEGNLSETAVYTPPPIGR